MVCPNLFLGGFRSAKDFFDIWHPGDRCREILEAYESYERFEPYMTDAIRQELAAYTDEELYTVNAVYTWRKPVELTP